MGEKERIVNGLLILREMAADACMRYGKNSRQFEVYCQWIAEKLQWASPDYITMTEARREAKKKVLQLVEELSPCNLGR